MNKSSGGGYEPEGQQKSGTPAVSLPNPKTQPSSLNDGSGALGGGSTSTGYPVASDRQQKTAGGQVPSDDVINEYVSAGQAGEPATRNVSANRVYRVQP